MSSILLESIKRRFIPLDYENLLSAAILRTGLKYCGGPECEEALKVLINSCNAEARLSLVGRIATRQNLLELLETRFRLIDYWQQKPEILAQTVHPQIFITGVPKSGSTLLHRLFAHDPANRVPLMWEVMFPVPPPVRSSYDSDPRIERADKRLNWLRRIHPTVAEVHPIGARIPQECGAIMGFSFESNVFLDMFSIYTYEKWLRSRDISPAYDFHQNFLKHLQWLCPAERWVLKSSDHVHALTTLIQIYPEARIIFLHRDPVKVLQNATGQMTFVKNIFSRKIDLSILGKYEARGLYEKVHKIMEFRKNYTYLEDRFMDVRYLDLAQDPLATMRAIYERFGLALSPDAETRMEACLKAECGRKSPERFSLADFSLDPDEEDPHFDLYCERFSVRRELLN